MNTRYLITFILWLTSTSALTTELQQPVTNRSRARRDRQHTLSIPGEAGSPFFAPLSLSQISTTACKTSESLFNSAFKSPDYVQDEMTHEQEDHESSDNEFVLVSPQIVLEKILDEHRNNFAVTMKRVTQWIDEGYFFPIDFEEIESQANGLFTELNNKKYKHALDSIIEIKSIMKQHEFEINESKSSIKVEVEKLRSSLDGLQESILCLGIPGAPAARQKPAEPNPEEY